MIKTDTAERLARVILTNEEKKSACDELCQLTASASAFPTDGEIYNTTCESFLREDIPVKASMSKIGSIYSGQHCMPSSEK